MRIISILAILGLVLSASTIPAQVITTSSTSHVQGNGLGAPPAQPTNPPPAPVNSETTTLGPGQSCTDSHGTTVRCDSGSGGSSTVVKSQHIGSEWIIKEVKIKNGKATIWGMTPEMVVTVDRYASVDIASGTGGRVNMAANTSANCWGAGIQFNGPSGQQTVNQGPGAGFTITTTPGNPPTTNVNSSPNSFHGIENITWP